jgi:hypothetical protein
MKKSLNLELQQSVSQNGLYLDNLMVEDLFVLTAMKQLSQNIESKNIIEVIYYLGDGKMKSPYDIDLSITDENLCEKNATIY